MRTIFLTLVLAFAFLLPRKIRLSPPPSSKCFNNSKPHGTATISNPS